MTTPLRLDGRVAVVTGAARGLGRSFALGLARQGASVIVNDIGTGVEGDGYSSDPANAVVEEIRAAGGRAMASHESVASREGGEAIIGAALDAFGKVDILVSNAGIARHKPFLEQTDEDWDKTLATHLAGAFHVSQPAFAAMKSQGFGRILLISSSATLGIPWRAAYASAKGGILGLMSIIAGEGEPHGITCNSLLPGAFTRGAALKGDVPEALVAMKNAIVELQGMDVDFVTPLALYLTSERCRESNMIFSAVGGRYARLFWGLTPGWQGPVDLPADPQAIEDHFDEIIDRNRYYVPQSALTELLAIGEGQKAMREGR
jgi:NAD(P)-dependent dehydrogenase (short-subunit alcohol dehydrogenase family)